MRVPLREKTQSLCVPLYSPPRLSVEKWRSHLWRWTFGTHSEKCNNSLDPVRRGRVKPTGGPLIVEFSSAQRGGGGVQCGTVPGGG